VICHVEPPYALTTRFIMGLLPGCQRTAWPILPVAFRAADLVPH
jgi:hypothetical protein